MEDTRPGLICGGVTTEAEVEEQNEYNTPSTAEPDMGISPMKAGDILRVINEAGGTDFFYLINEIQVGNLGCEDVVLLQSLSRKPNQERSTSEYHQVPYQLLTATAEVYTKR